MSLYPSLEEMKVDRLYQAQFETQNAGNPNQGNYIQPAETLPYPLQPSRLYPSLSDYMGLELTPAVLAENMPEYLPENQQVASTYEVRLVVPVSGILGAFVTNGICEMSLCKDGNGKLGLRVQAINNGIFITLVQKDSPAAVAGLRFGDQILQIQGKNMAGMSEDQVHDMIKKAPNTGINIVIRDRPLERTVKMHKDSAGKVGFTFKNGKIMHLVMGSSAARNGLLTEHQLLEVNGQNVVGLKDKEITKIIDDAGSVIAVTVIPSFIYEHMTKKISPKIFQTMDHSVW